MTRLTPKHLKKVCNKSELPFETTEEINPSEGMIGQTRGVDALKFGLKMKTKGYNVFVTGLTGTGRSTFTHEIAKSFAEQEPVPKDWIYVYNFDNKDAPKAISMDTGQGKQFKTDMEDWIECVKKDIWDSFEDKEYTANVNEIYKEATEKQYKLLEKLNEKSTEYGFIFRLTTEGLQTALLTENSQLMTDEEYESMTEKDHEEVVNSYNEFNVEIHDEFTEINKLNNVLHKQINELDKEIVKELLEIKMNVLEGKYQDKPDIIIHLDKIKKDIIKNISKFKEGKHEDEFYTRYKVNLFIDNSHLKHAPVISDSNPVYNNLAGTIDYESNMGVLSTHFMKIKPGPLHYANGGYLIFQITEIASSPVSWEMIKRSLKTEKINIEDLNKLVGVAVTSSIKPEPIPLDVKIIIVGDTSRYNNLYRYDSDFKKLFKVKAAFDSEMERNKSNIQLVSQFVRKQCEDNNLKHFDRNAIDRLIELSSRLCDHQDKLTTEFNSLLEIIIEADFWASEDDSILVLREHVQKAIDQKVYRSNSYEERLSNQYKEDIILIDTQGFEVGQINGLAVMSTGDYSFGMPSKITANVFAGKDGIINIEREAEQSGNSYDKGIMIINGYIGSRYAKTKPLGLNISVGFEQNYGMVNGDSASSTELYAILSAMSDVPIDQGIAVTGSVNQKGYIQPIGGVNEKIEGFYETCKQSGLTGSQGVIIPIQNVKNLMLNDEVILAVKKKQFHIHAISKIEQGIKILTGKSLEELDSKIKHNLSTQEGTHGK